MLSRLIGGLSEGNVQLSTYVEGLSYLSLPTKRQLTEITLHAAPSSETSLPRRNVQSRSPSSDWRSPSASRLGERWRLFFHLGQGHTLMSRTTHAETQTFNRSVLCFTPSTGYKSLSGDPPEHLRVPSCHLVGAVELGDGVPRDGVTRDQGRRGQRWW
jgi:hypothetical protein